MAKKRTGLANTLNTNLGKKVELKKKDLNLDKVEKVSEKIHTDTPIEKKEVEKEKVILQKMTIEVPKTLHKQIKVKVAQDGLKIKDYIIQLVQKDLGI
ncbi:hypothetical protein [Aureispira sp. CCB-QB1]|uniref:hypothetical protein n=1 Tax=Aureispira sp. CCB-QB1 TaxID=1313421 RepID=UPI0006984F72|nr:hypothetical protein [Aureispira sp. CCB-QB1]